MENFFMPSTNPFKLEAVPPLETLEETVPKLGGAEAEEILSLKPDERLINNSRYALNRNLRILPSVMRSLAGRDLKNELPMDEETFAYRLNLKECERLQRLTNAAIDQGRLDLDDPRDARMFDDMTKLLALERQKAEWLEREFYPVVFRRTLRTAIGEVNQFLISEKNLHLLDRFQNPEQPFVKFVDELDYLLEGHDPKSAGVYSKDSIAIRMPETYTDRDEWRVYNVIVHELLHHVSHQEYNRLGLMDSSSDPEFTELNEAVTEILAFTISQRHLQKGKTPLKGERQQANRLDNRGYSEYTILVKQLFSKIPLGHFIDAMLNREGMDRLRKKFTEIYGDEQALADYGRNLRDLFLSPQQRRAQSLKRTNGPTTETRGQVIPLKRRSTPPEAIPDDKE